LHLQNSKDAPKDPSLASIKSQLFAIDANALISINVVNASSFLCNSQKKSTVSKTSEV
jgi:hypothetical protein